MRNQVNHLKRAPEVKTATEGNKASQPSKAADFYSGR